MSLRKNTKFIVFDYDGTLADTFNMNYKILKEFLEKNGVENFNKEKFIWIGTKNAYTRLRELGLGSKQLKSFIKNLENKSLNSNQQPKIFDNLKFVLKQLSKKYNLIIITSNTTKVVKKFLKYHKINNLFLEILGADVEKDKAKKVRKIIKKSNLNKNEVVYIGDTAGDMLEAKQVGVKGIGATWGYAPESNLRTTKPYKVLRKPKSLLRLFG